MDGGSEDREREAPKPGEASQAVLRRRSVGTYLQCYLMFLAHRDNVDARHERVKIDLRARI